jgi:hypothetical protein
MSDKDHTPFVLDNMEKIINSLITIVHDEFFVD